MAFTPEGQTRAKIQRLRKKGLTARDIAQLLGLSVQAVHWHIQKLKQPVAKEATGKR